LQFRNGWQELGRSDLDMGVVQKKVTWAWGAGPEFKQNWEHWLKWSRPV